MGASRAAVSVGAQILIDCPVTFIKAHLRSPLPRLTPPSAGRRMLSRTKMNLLVATHGHCFDGAASAALFTRLCERYYREGGEYRYLACGYGAGQATPAGRFKQGDINAILDYQYTPSPHLTWYFDHHPTAFANEEARQNFESQQDTGRFFHDQAAGSCTKLIQEVAQERLGLDLGLSELVHWANVVDTAAFSSAEEANARSHPVLRLAAVVEEHGEGPFLTKMIRRLARQPLLEVAESAPVKTKYAPLEARQERYMSQLRKHGTQSGRVAFVDLTFDVVKSGSKFAPYAAYPQCMYSVIVARLKSSMRISVGFNPWCGQERDTDLSKICAKHGGGGHPFVGGIALPAGDAERALSIAREVAAQLEAAP